MLSNCTQYSAMLSPALTLAHTGNIAQATSSLAINKAKDEYVGSLNLNVCWNRLFTKQWERNTVLVSTKIKVFRDLYLQPGTIAFFTPEFDYSPFLLMSINL